MPRPHIAAKAAKAVVKIRMFQLQWQFRELTKVKQAQHKLKFLTDNEFALYIAIIEIVIIDTEE